MTTIYTTVSELIEREIVAALGEHASDFDIDAIVRHLLDTNGIEYSVNKQGFRLTISTDEFWALVPRFEIN